MPIRKVKEITREKEESQFVAHPPPCHSQGTNVTDAVSAASSCSRREILDNEWTFLLLSFKLKTHHTAALGTNRLREGGRLSVKYPPPFYCLGSGRWLGTNWGKINEGVLFNKSNRLGEENTITGAEWYNSFVRWYPLEVRVRAAVCLLLRSFQFSKYIQEKMI